MQGISAVKVFGWEAAFTERVRVARSDELKLNARVQRLNALSSSSMETVPILCALVSLPLPRSTSLLSSLASPFAAAAARTLVMDDGGSLLCSSHPRLGLSQEVDCLLFLAFWTAEV